MSAAIRVLVVDDDPLVRAGLAMILDAAPGLTLVGEAADGTEVVPAVDACAPDVVLMDIRMPKLDGLAATELLRARPDPPEVIVLTTFHADEHVLRALRAGASGFLLKDTPPTEILHAISRVAAGEPILSPAVTRQLIAHVGTTGADARQRHARTMLARVSEREREVATAVGRVHELFHLLGYLKPALVASALGLGLYALQQGGQRRIARLRSSAAHAAGKRPSSVSTRARSWRTQATVHSWPPASARGRLRSASSRASARSPST